MVKTGYDSYRAKTSTIGQSVQLTMLCICTKSCINSFSVIILIYLNAAIECPLLDTITNSKITYSTDTSPNYSLGTTATYSCSEGYFLEVTASTNVVRTCVANDVMDAIGVWNGSTVECQQSE